MVRNKKSVTKNALKESWLYLLTFLLIALFLVLYSKGNSVLDTKKENNSVNVIEESVESPDNSDEALEEKTENNNLQEDGDKKELDSSSQKVAGEISVKKENKEVDTNSPDNLLAEEKEKSYVTFKITGINEEQKIEFLDGESSFDVLLRLAATKGIAVGYKQYSFGKMITRIGDIKAEGTYYWALYYNGNYSILGAEDLKVQDGDLIEWKYESWQ